jgi:hypothetical protein
MNKESHKFDRDKLRYDIVPMDALGVSCASRNYTHEQ